MLEIRGNWNDHVPFIEFTYNNSFHTTIGMTLFKALCGMRYRSFVGWFELGEMAMIGPNFMLEGMENVKLIRKRLKMAQSRRKSYL